MALIELKELGRSFLGGRKQRVHALRGVSLSIEEGEFVCVTGPSGAGKSTLLNILGCLDRPSRGSYRFAGREVLELSTDHLALLRRREFGFVFQNCNLIDSANALENVALPGRYAGMPGAERSRRARRLLAKLGMASRAQHLPSELSGGEQQRVALARALMNDGRVILADEPTNALDQTRAKQVIETLGEASRNGKTVVLVTQDPEIASSAPRRIELRKGRVVSDSGAPRRRPVTPRTVRSRGPHGWIQPIGMGLSALRSSFASANRLRVAASVLGVCFAVFLGSMSFILADGIYARTVSSVNEMGLDRITVLPNPGRSMREGGFTWLTMEDALAIQNEVAGVRALSPLKLIRREFIRHGGNAGEFGVQGIVDRGARTNRGRYAYRLAAGAPVTPEDDERMARVAVLDSVTRDRLFPGEASPVGQDILIRGMPFRVKGVYEYRANPIQHLSEQSEEEFRAMQDNANSWVYMPFRTFVALLAEHEWLFGIYVFVENPDRLFEVAGAIRDLGVRRHGEAVYFVEHGGASIQEAKQQRNRIRLGLGALSGVILAIAAFSIMSITSMAVRTRRQEIGIRLAVGARRRDIFRQFLTESLALSLTGAASGVMLALAAARIPGMFDIPVQHYSFIWAPLACALLAGLVFGSVPAWRAARLDPVAALASE